MEKDGKPVSLTVKEFEILRLFLRNPKRVYTKAALYAKVWEDEFLADENAIQVHVSRLRNKIEDDPKNPRSIVTVWGIGYRLGEEPAGEGRHREERYMEEGRTGEGRMGNGPHSEGRS